MAELSGFLRKARGRFGVSLLGLVCTCAVFAATAAAAAPVVGSISGPVTSVKGATFKVTTNLSPTGTATVSVSKTTAITAQKTLSASVLKTGDCVMATGAKNAKGVVTATRITLSAAVKGTCTTGFTRRGTRPPGSGNRPPGAGTGGGPGGGGGFGNFANFGFAFGKISALKGKTLTVKGTRGSTAVTTTVMVSAKTQVAETVKVGDGAIAAKSCAFVRGTSSDKGVTVKAQSIALTQPSATGCRFGFAGR